MALLYPWATKEYLLWNMSLGQIVMYYNLGMEMKYPRPESVDGKRSVKNMTAKEVAELRDDLRRQYGEIG